MIGARSVSGGNRNLSPKTSDRTPDWALNYGLLYDAGNHGRHAGLARRSVILGYPCPPHGIGAVASAKQTFCHFILVGSQVWQKVPYFHLVGSTTPLVGLDLCVRPVKVIGSQDILQRPV